MKKWNRTPMFIMRLSCVEDVIKTWLPAEFVEIGAGTGEFTSVFLDGGYNAVCYDLGEENRSILRENLKEYGENAAVVDSLDEIKRESFDYLFSFEVLEHIEDDMDALRKWTDFLKPGGRILLSVPAHAKKFSKDDEFNGHLRRYEKKRLYELLKLAGYKDIKIINYGFPLGNITGFVNSIFFDYISKKNAETLKLSKEKRSIKSGVERCENVVRLSFLFNRFFMYPFLILQRFFYNADLGDGLVAYAKKV